jgi:hypothetical protein
MGRPSEVVPFERGRDLHMGRRGVVLARVE